VLTPDRIAGLALRAGPYGILRRGPLRSLTVGKIQRSVHGIDLGPLEPRLPGLLRTPGKRVQLAPQAFLAEAARLPVASRKPDEAEQDARRDARDARGRSGNRSANDRGGDRSSGQGRVDGRRDDRTPGGRAQGRDGRPRDPNPRSAGERGPVGNPVRATPGSSAGQGERQPRGDRHDTPKDAPRDGQPRNFRPRGPGGSGGVGQHRNKVRRAV
jgi:ATP-dependent RNA helicase RhlE